MAGKKKEISANPQNWEDVPEIPKEEQPWPLPEGWKWVYLGNAIQLLRGVSYSKEDAHKQRHEDDCLILRGGNIKEGYIDFNDSDNVYINKDLVKDEQLIKKNDIVIVSSTGSIKVIGRAGIADKNCYNVAFGAFLTLARPNEYFNSRYVDYFFQSEIYRNRIKSLVKGVNINNIKTEYIVHTPFPVPSLETQQRIVNHIESLFYKLDEAAEKVQAVIDSHEARKQAILHKAFSGELTRKWREENGVSLESWEEKSIVEVTKFIRAGGDKPDDFQENKDEKHNIPVIANGLENDGIIGYTGYSKNYEKTLTIAARGTIGFPFLRDYDYFPVIRLLVISPDEVKIIPKYLYYIFLAFPEKGTGSSIPQLTVPKLKEKIFSVCSLEEQKELVPVIETIFSKLDEEFERYLIITNKINYLKNFILNMAFAGKYNI